jgi:Na+/proline symporter
VFTPPTLLKGLFVLFAIILFVICLWDLKSKPTRRINKTLQGFFLANKITKETTNQLGTTSRLQYLGLQGFVAAILSANLSYGNFLIFVAIWGYAWGWVGIFWFIVNLTLNVFAYWVFQPAYKKYVEDDSNSGTIHEFISQTFGHIGKDFSVPIRWLASATTVFGLIFCIVFEIHLVSEFLSKLLGFDTFTIFGLLTAIICIYSAFGGFHTLVYTDKVQAIAMSIGIIPLLFILFGGFGFPNVLLTSYPLPNISSPSSIWTELTKIGWPNIVSICVIGSGWFNVAMDQWQRACATRELEDVVQRGMLWYWGVISCFALVYGLMGMYVNTFLNKAFPKDVVGADPLREFFYATQLPQLSSPLFTFAFALVALALLAAAMSTANTFLVVSGHSIVSDLLLDTKNKEILYKSRKQLSTEDEEALKLEESLNFTYILYAKVSILCVGICTLIAWLCFQYFNLLSQALNFFFIAYSIQFSLLASMVCSKLPDKYRPKARWVFFSILSGVITTILCGIGFWSLIQANTKEFLGLPVADVWFPLTPVITFVVGLAFLLPSVISRLSYKEVNK